MFRNRIVFRSDNPGRASFWVMDATGENRQYLGSNRAFAEAFNMLRERERLSPVGNYRLFVQDAQPSAQVFIERPPHDLYGPLPPLQLTHNTGLSYDPVWSPDGGRVAYVSTENGSDDIWVIDTDGTGNRWLVNNDWEWDKHPSWSPDSRRIAFWSNRTGLKQIYVMDADGGNVRNLSNNAWDEYHPIWIK